MVERAIVMQVLRDDHEQRWSRAELACAISDHSTATVDVALSRLRRDGVLRRGESCVCASRATRRLDELELIGL
jgi:DNA-binding HxlR family transcriptional regulator